MITALITHPHFELILFGIGLLLFIIGSGMFAYAVIKSVSEGSNFDDKWTNDTK